MSLRLNEVAKPDTATFPQRPYGRVTHHHERRKLVESPWWSENTLTSRACSRRLFTRTFKKLPLTSSSTAPQSLSKYKAPPGITGHENTRVMLTRRMPGLLFAEVTV